MSTMREKYSRLAAAGFPNAASEPGAQAEIRAEMLRQHGSQYGNYLKEFYTKLEALLAVRDQLQGIQAEADKDAAEFFGGQGLDLRPGGLSKVEAVLDRDTLAELKASAKASGFEVGN